MATPLALVWDLIARDNASPAFARVGAAAEGTAAKTEAASKHIALFATAVAATAAAVAVHAVKMAGDFQYQMNRMTTAAGESQKNLKLISNGVLALMSTTGTSAKEAAAGLYQIESAGYHGAAALQVLTNVAKGAKIENADLATVANAVSSAMVDYHVNAANSAEVMNTLIAAVAHGKTTLGEMSAAFSNVGAAGATANIPMADLASAIATMTQHGTDAAKAGTYLRQVIGQLEAPSAKARSVMQSLGLDANKVGQTLSSGPGGLAAAISVLETAITAHLTPSGLVALNMFKKSTDPVTAYQKVLANLPPTLVTTFGALSEMTGGVRSLQGFLQLGGENLKTFQANTLAVNEAVRAGGKDVEGWASTQKTFNVRMDQFRQTINALWIRLGTALLPVFTRLAVASTGFFQGLSGNVARMDQSDRPKLELFGLGLRAMFEAIRGGGVTSGGFVGAMEHIGVAIRALLTAFKSLLAAVAPLVQQAWPYLVRGFEAAIDAVTALGGALTAIGGFLRGHRTLVQSVTVAVAVLAAGMLAYNLAVRVVGRGLFIFATAQKAVGAAMAFTAANPVFAIILGIAALAAGLIYAYKHSEKFRDVVHTVWRDVKAVIFGAYHDVILPVYHGIIDGVHGLETAWRDTTGALSTAWRDTWGVVKTVWDAVSPTLKVIGEIFYAVIGGTILASIEAVKIAWRLLWGFFKLQWDTIGRPVIDAVGASIAFMWNDLAKPVFAALRLAWDALWAFFRLQWQVIGRPVFAGVKVAVDVLWGGVKVVFDLLRTQWNLTWTVLRSVWDTIGAPIFHTVRTVVDGLWTFLSATFGKISDGWSSLWSTFPKVFGAIWDGITDAAAAALNGIIDVLNAFIGAIDWILDKLPGGLHIGDIPHVRAFHHSTGAGATGGAGGAGVAHALANGGVIPGYAPGVDSVAAMLSPGEGVLVPEAVRGLGGAGWVHAVNGMFSRRAGGNHALGGVPHFGFGGVIGGVFGGIGDAIKHLTGVALGAALTAAEIPVHAALKLLPGGILRGLGTGLFDRVDHGLRSMLYDSGGMLPPGVTLAVNGTGRPERILTNGQFDKLSGGGMTVEHLQVVYQGEPPVLSQTLPDVQRSLSYQLGRF